VKIATEIHELPISHSRFSWLPVVEDEDEAPEVYGYLCDLIQANHPIVLGANNANLPRIVSIIAEAFHREVVPIAKPEAARMLSIVKQIELNPDVFQACVSQLTAEQKHGLEEAYRALATA
jgi:importin-5